MLSLSLDRESILRLVLLEGWSVPGAMDAGNGGWYSLLRLRAG